MVKRIIAMLVMLRLIGCLAIPAFAAHPVPDLSKKGSITFVMSLDGELLDGGKLNLYRVGDIAEEDGNYSFALTDPLDGSDLTLDDVSDPALAQELLTLAKAVKLEKITAPIEDGAAVFTELPVGLYLVFQNKGDATRGFSPIQPFLISIPRFQNGDYELEIVAKPKVPLETAPTEPSTPPSTPPPSPPPNLPQTGQLNWPVPVMAILGCVLFVLGFILCIDRKRR